MNKKAKKEYKDFESAMSRLEEITSDLETGDKSLEDSIVLYTEGVEIASICNTRLTEAEGHISKLTKMTDSFKLTAFEEEADD